MASLNDIIKLAKTEGGKFFVMDETGDIKLVILAADDYEEMVGKRPAPKHEPAVDPEKINREILQAQLHDLESEVVHHPAPEFRATASPRVDLREEVIDPTFDFEGPKINIEDI